MSSGGQLGLCKENGLLPQDSRCGEKFASENPEACTKEGTLSFPAKESKGWDPE